MKIIDAIYNICFPKPIVEWLDEENEHFSSNFIMWITIFYVLILGLNIWFTISTVYGYSMYPTLNNGDFLISMKIDNASDIERGDVIILRKEAFFGDKYLVKRVVGMPGDTMEIKDSDVYINNKEYEEKYIQDGIVTDCLPGKFIVLEGKYFVMGDNRPHSADSRSFGYVEFNECNSVVFEIIKAPKPLSMLLNMI